MTRTFIIRTYRKGDECGVKSVLREAAFSNIWPGVRVSVSARGFQYVTAAFVGVATWVTRASIIGCITGLCFPFLVVCLAHCAAAIYYAFGPPLFDLNKIAGIYQTKDDTNFWIAEVPAACGNKVIGTIAIATEMHGLPESANVAYLRRMSVLKSWRRRGVANCLLKTAVEFCKEHSYQEIKLITTNVHQAAMQLYLKYGFYCHMYKPYYYLHGLVAIWTYELVYNLHASGGHLNHCNGLLMVN